MATRKRKQAGHFFVGTSACGNLTQLFINDCDCQDFSSLAAAMAATPDVMENHESATGERPQRVYILKVVAEGRTSGVTWDE